MSDFKWRQFEGEIIVLEVRWYCRYGISYRQSRPWQAEAIDPSRARFQDGENSLLLVLQNTPQTAITLPGLTLELLPMPPEAAQFDITLNLTETDDTLSGFLQFAANRYDRATIEGFAAGFLALLDCVAADPTQPASLSLLTPPPAAPSAAAVAHDFLPPATPAEETLATLWTELLHLDRVGRHDNFFELGGHSLRSPRNHNPSTCTLRSYRAAA